MVPLLLQAWRSWKSAKTLALLVIVAFAAGIGSTTAIYTVVNTLLLKPVPYQHGHRFVSLLGGELNNPDAMSALSLNDVLAYQQMRSFDVFGWMQFTGYNLTAPGQPMYLKGVEVTPSLANNVGIQPRLGRWFRDSSGREVVISHGLWVRLGSESAIVGGTIALDRQVFTVSGVMPPGFQLPLAGPVGVPDIDVWVPTPPLREGQDRTRYDNFCYARLRPGVSLEQARAEAKSVAAIIARADPDSHPSYTARLDDLQQLVARDVKPMLLLLFGAAEILLLITCANVGGLLLARSVARARETAVRNALGARLRQLAAQYFFEGLFVAVPGAAGGLLLGAAAVRAITRFADQAPRAGEIGIDWRVVLFVLGTGLVASAITSMAPLWQAVRTLPNEVLSDGVRASAGARTRRLSQWLVIAEIALAFVLLAAGALLISETRHLTRIWPGFDPNQLLTFQLSFNASAIPGKPTYVAYQARLVEALEAIPGVSAVGFVNQLPLNGCCFSTTVYPDDASAHRPAGERVSFLPVNSGYLRAMRIPLRRGRFLNDHDTTEDVMSAVINQATARRYWPHRDPVGVFGRLGGPKGSRFQVVGVVGDVKNDGLDNPTEAEIYIPSLVTAVNPMYFAVRSALPPATLIPQVRRAIQNVNPGQPIHEVMMMSEIARESLSVKRWASYVMTFFAFAALLMAIIGTYGVVSYSVRQRTVEFGTRMALGAVSRDLLALVLGSGLRMAVHGIVIGGAASVGATWLLIRELHIQTLGWVPFALSACIVGLVAMASSFFPAWGATLLSPMVAIRNQPESMWESAREGFGRWFAGFSGGHDVTNPPEATLTTDLVEAARRATSFREAFHAALEALRAGIGAESVFLLEKVSGDEYRATTGVPDQRDCSIPGRGLLLNRLRFHDTPLAVTPGDLDVWRRWAAENKPEHLAEIEALETTGARLAVPLRTSKEVLGVLLLGAPDGRPAYSQAEKRLLRTCADQFALMLENARLTDRVLEQEKLSRDLALAAEVQKRLLPRQSLETRVASLAGASLPARSVGGDYYDFLDLGDDRVGIALADVAGKGVAAALIMSVVQASLRVISSERDITLPQLAAKMNHFLCRSTGTSSYATFFYAQLDQRSGEFSYVNAGHNPPYLFRVDGASMAVEELSTGGTIIGMFPQALYEEGRVCLRPGDVLMIFTDGVTDALNPEEEEFGEERLKDLLRQAVDLPVEEISVRIWHELKNWIQSAAQYDDITFVLMKVK